MSDELELKPFKSGCDNNNTTGDQEIEVNWQKAFIHSNLVLCSLTSSVSHGVWASAYKFREVLFQPKGLELSLFDRNIYGKNVLILY